MMARTHKGGCHCGEVRFEATADISKVMACNCSICKRKAALMSFVSAEHFKLLHGEKSLSDYQFAKKRLHHLFCKVCGIHAFATGSGPDGQVSYCINVNCLDDVNLESLSIQRYDGAKV